MKTNLDSEILKSVVITLQGKVDQLEAENKSLREGTLPAAYQGINDDIWATYSPPRFGTPFLGPIDYSSLAVRSLDAELQLERDIALESNNIVAEYKARISDLEQENKKFKKKISRIESGNFDEFFTYATIPIQLPPLGTAITSITITREADFYLTKIVRIQNAPFAFLARDSSNDRQWSNIPLHSDLGAGTAKFPLILPKPRFIARASTITIELTNLAKEINEVRLALIGYKIYHVEQLWTTA